MAYPTVDKTYGFKPINRLDGLPYAGQTRLIPIAASYATAILNGDTVSIDTNGVIVAKTTSDSGTAVGVLVGCQYVNSLGQTVQSQSYPASASTSTNPAYAYVVDDPFATFKVVAAASSTTTPTGYTRALVGSNVAMATATGSTTTGDSAYGINGASATTDAAFPIRVVDVVPETSYISGGVTYYYEFVVKFNLHQYLATTGV